MKKLDLAKIKKLKPNPIFKGLSPRLKNPDNFVKIEKELIDCLKSDHKHRIIKAYVSCAWCQKKLQLKQQRMLAMGFKDYGQYVEWRRVMQIIRSKANFRIR